MSEEQETLDAEVREAVEALVPEGELVMQAIVILEVMHPDGERGLRLKATDMPWWQLNGMLSGVLVTLEEVSTDDPSDP